MPLNFINANGLTLHVSAKPAGGRPPLIFSNSLGTDFRIWNSVIDQLSDQFACHAYDKRGHGLSDAPPAPYLMDDHIGDLVAVMDHFGLDKAMICGLSVGGMIAQGFALAHPDRVSGLILCDTGHKIGTEAMWNERIAAVEAGGIEALADSILQRWFSPAFHREQPIALNGWRQMLTRTPVAGYVGTSYALRDTDYTDRVGSIGVPTLCVVGDRDGSTPPALVEELAGLIPGARCEIIADAGHLPCIEQPDRLVKLIRHFAKEKGLT